MSNRLDYTVVQVIHSIWGSPAVRASLIYGFGGLGFSLGNLLMAGAMSQSEYGWVVLSLTLTQLAANTGHLGVSSLVVRHAVDATPSLLLRTALTSLLVALAIGVSAHLLYGMPGALIAVMILWGLSSSLNSVAAGLFRSREKFGNSLLLVQIHNGALVIVGVAVVCGLLATSVGVSTSLALAVSVSVLAGWRIASRLPRRATTHDKTKLPWSEGVVIMAADMALVLLISIERLLVPKLLELEALALLAVLQAVVGAPFRMLQMGVGYTLTPRLRSAKTSANRKRLLIDEAIIATSLVGIAGVFLYFLAPGIVGIFVADKYFLEPNLIAASILGGVAKVAGAYASSIVTALGSKKHLKSINWGSWISVAGALYAGNVGSQYGLVGLVLGISFAWCIYAIITLLVALSSLGYSARK